MIEGVWPHVRDDDWCGDWKLMTQRVEARPSEPAPGPLIPAFLAPTPLPPRAATLSTLPLPGTSAALTPTVMSIGGATMAASGRGD
jgi:hypothetical protein